MNIENIIKEAQELLYNNPEWKNRYKGYADNLSANISIIKLTITEQTAPVNSEQTAPVISLQTAPLKNMFLG